VGQENLPPHDHRNHRTYPPQRVVTDGFRAAPVSNGKSD